MTLDLRCESCVRRMAKAECPYCAGPVSSLKESRAQRMVRNSYRAEAEALLACAASEPVKRVAQWAIDMDNTMKEQQP